VLFRSGWEHACERAGVRPCKPLTDDDKRQLVELVQREEVGGLDEGAFFMLASPLLSLSPDDAKAMSDAWLCGAILDADLYTRLSGGHKTSFFPAYRDPHKTDPQPKTEAIHVYAD